MWMAPRHSEEDSGTGRGRTSGSLQKPGLPEWNETSASWHEEYVLRRGVRVETAILQHCILEKTL